MKGRLRQFEVCARLGISDETWMRWRRAGRVPAHVEGPGAKEWRVSDIEAFESGETFINGRRVLGKRFFARHGRSVAS